VIPLAKNISRYFSFKEITIVVLAIVISVSAGVGVFLSLKKEVSIDDNGKQFVVKTMKTTVREVLDQSGIDVEPEDYISQPLDAKLQKIKRNEIYIKKAVPVNVLVDGQKVVLKTYKETIGEALENSPVKLTQNDKLVDLQLSDKVQSNMEIQVIRVNENVITEKSDIPFNVITKENNRLDKGTEKIVEQGKTGIKEKQFKVVFEDGKEVARQLIKEAITSNPIDKIVEIGTILNHKTARGDNVRYQKVLDMRATAYTASFKDTGKDPDHPLFGITATGIRAYKGVIAVDPRVIPLGTRVYVEVAGDTPDYGYAVAADTGGAIKGDLIDLYYDSQDFVDRWGVKRVKVYVLTD
jgi:uncharacterized protein YabE (DUF348 family)